MSNALSDEEDDMISRRLRFKKEIYSMYAGSSTKLIWSKERINRIIRLIQEFAAASAPEAKKQRFSSHCYYAKHYEIVEEVGQKCLILKRKAPDDKIIRVIPVDKYYDVLHEIHQSTGHGRLDKMLLALKYVYSIPTHAVIAFVKLCKICQKRKAARKKRDIVPVRPLDNLNNRGLVKLINLASTPDGNYKWILHYQDYTTKFLLLRPLTSNDATEVSSELLKIFLEIGCPAILQIENGREYTADVIKELASLWPSWKILNGRPVADSVNLSTEANENVYIKVIDWMLTKKSTNWARGLYSVQFEMNCTYHPSIQKTPYKALFGCDPKVGMDCSDEFLSKISNEEELELGTTIPYVSNIQRTASTAVESPQPIELKIEYCPIDTAGPSSHNEEPVVLLEQNKQMKSVLKEECEDSISDETMQNFTAPLHEQVKLECNVITDQPMQDIEENKQIKEECEDSISDETMQDTTAPLYEEVKLECDTITDHPMQDMPQCTNTVNQEQTPLLPMKICTSFSTSAHNQILNPILCVVCGNQATAIHSCGSCHRILHETCGITASQRPTLLCLQCHMDTVKNYENHNENKKVTVYSSKVRRTTSEITQKQTKPIKEVSAEMELTKDSAQVDNNTPKVQKRLILVPLRGRGESVINPPFVAFEKSASFKSKSIVSVIKCTCKESKTQCNYYRCVCKKNGRICTTRCHKSLGCLNLDPDQIEPPFL